MLDGHDPGLADQKAKEDFHINDRPPQPTRRHEALVRSTLEAAVVAPNMKIVE